MQQNVDILLGLQYGSEGKGIVAAALAGNYAASIRVGGSNAGHSFYKNGRKYVFRHVPCAAVHPETKLFIARGALISPAVLAEELEACSVDPHRLIIDPYAYPILSKDAEKEAARAMSERIGSTCKGVGEALVSRIRRDPFEWAERSRALDIYRRGTVDELLEQVGTGSVLIESTQGTSLSLYSDNYPYCTSRDISTAAVLSEAGISHRRLGAILGVLRTFPIRVAGNSGPMQNETTWEAISKSMGRDIIERTTVTQKVRRVAEFDMEQVKRAVILNGVTHLFVTFMDYLHPEAGKAECFAELPQVCKDWVDTLERAIGIPVIGVSNGPNVDRNVLECEPYLMHIRRGVK